MQKRILPTAIAAILLITIIGFGCTKLDTTTLGSDLVAVDNVNTFADTLLINTDQGVYIDSTQVTRLDDHVLGKITNDPIFGSSEGQVFLQLKPSFYPFYFGNAGDVIRTATNPLAGLDSAVLCLSYGGGWGDTTASAIPQKFEVYTIIDNQFRDSTNTVRDIRYQPTLGASIGSVTFSPSDAARITRFKTNNAADSATGQIRIPLNFAFSKALFESDSSGVNPFKNDSLYRRFGGGAGVNVNGFAIKATSTTGNTLYYVNLADTKTSLDFYFRKVRTGTTTTVDTTHQSFYLYSTVADGVSALSSTGNYIKRTYSTPINAGPNNNVLYVQGTAGVGAQLTIPGLDTMTNKIIHRAYVVAEQIPDTGSPFDALYPAPSYMYLELRDNTTAELYKPIYYDLNQTTGYLPDETTNYFPYNNVDPVTFGGKAMTRYEGSAAYSRYEINITRYVQHIVTNHLHNYKLRMHAPYSIVYPQYLPTALSGYGSTSIIPFYNALAAGRVRLYGGGTTQPHRMKLVVVYSKVN